MSKKYVMCVEKYNLFASLISLGYVSEFISAKGMLEDGTIIDLNEQEYRQLSKSLPIADWEDSRLFGHGWHEYTWDARGESGRIGTSVKVREEYLTSFLNNRKRGRSIYTVMQRMSEEIRGESLAN